MVNADQNLDKVCPAKFLAVDLGAESGRAFVATLDGERIALEEVHRFPNTPVEISGHLHWDVPELFQQLKMALKLTAEKGHGDIVSIGVNTWGVDFGLVRKSDGSIDLPFTYRDSRTNGMMQKVFSKIPRHEIYARTGIQMMQINSIFQLYSAIEERESCLRDFESLLFMPDIFNYFLTGRQVSEYTIASTSQLLNAGSRNFDEAIFAALGIPQRLMRPIIMPATIIGKVRSDILAEVGLNNIDVIAVGSHDTASAVAAIPASGTDWAYLSSGTWSLIGIENDEPIINGESLANNFTNEGGVGGKITFLQNITGMWFLQEVMRRWESTGRHYAYEELLSAASEAQEFKCVFDPADDIFLNPPDMYQAIASFCRKTGQACPQTMGELVRSIFESLAFKYKSALGKLASVTGRKIARLHVVGGGSQNEMLNRFAADATGLPVAAGPVEATIVGNALTQALAVGRVGSLEMARKIVGNSFQLKEYLPENARKWDEAYKSAPFNF